MLRWGPAACWERAEGSAANLFALPAHLSAFAAAGGGGAHNNDDDDDDDDGLLGSGGARCMHP